MLIHTIERAGHPSPTCISPLALNGENFVVSFSDASILVYDTRTGEELIGMASNETYDGTPATGITSVVATSQSIEGQTEAGRGGADEEGIHGPTGSSNGGGLEGVIISGHEDQYIRFFDANSGKHTSTNSDPRATFLTSVKVNAHTKCSPILLPSRPCLSAKTATKLCPLVMMLLSASGRSINASAHKKSPLIE
jgi:hypothetical protein